jgi:hypothetical protein
MKLRKRKINRLAGEVGDTAVAQQHVKACNRYGH